jgi:hypothetical protein
VINVNIDLWNRYLNSVNYVKTFAKMPVDDLELFKLFFEAQEEFKIRPKSLDSVGIFNLGANFTTAMAMVGLLRPYGRIDHIEHTYNDIRFMASFLSYEKTLYYRDVNGNVLSFYTHEPFEQYDSSISQMGGQYWRNTLERSWKSTRVIAGNMLAPPDFPYSAVTAFFVGETFSHRKSICVQAWKNMLKYLEPRGFFATAVMLESEEFITPDGIRIPLGRFKLEDLKKIFDSMPVEYKVYVTSGNNDIRPGYDRVALIAGRLDGPIN